MYTFNAHNYIKHFEKKITSPMSYKKKGLFKENIELSHGGLDAWLWGDGKGGGVTCACIII